MCKGSLNNFTPIVITSYSIHYTKLYENIVPIAAFTAGGELARLVPALNKGLDDGLSINEIKEVMVHLYAYRNNFV